MGHHFRPNKLHPLGPDELSRRERATWGVGSALRDGRLPLTTSNPPHSEGKQLHRLHRVHAQHMLMPMKVRA